MDSYKTFREKLLQQLAIDLNCAPDDFLAKENIVTRSRLNEGRRSYSPGQPFLQMATLGGNTVIMADECLHEFLHGLIRDMEGHRLFALENLERLNEELKQYGYHMAPTHHMFLPCRDVSTEAGCEVRWLSEDGIRPFYGDRLLPGDSAQKQDHREGRRPLLRHGCRQYSVPEHRAQQRLPARLGGNGSGEAVNGKQTWDQGESA